jgi:uncharacterized protein (UPF0333 family)
MRGQAAFEYLLLFSLILGILSFLTFYAQQMTDRNREEIMISNAAIAVNKIVEASDIVYSQGKPSQITFSIYIPEKVNSIVFSNKMIIMKIGVSSGFSDIFATSKAPLQGHISINSGSKRIRVKAEENYVNITEV